MGSRKKPETFKVMVLKVSGTVLFNWQLWASRKEMRSYGYQDATLTLTPPPKPKKVKP